MPFQNSLLPPSIPPMLFRALAVLHWEVTRDAFVPIDKPCGPGHSQAVHWRIGQSKRERADPGP